MFLFRAKSFMLMIWATPMQRLAKELGISDVALAKTCKKLGVPRSDEIQENFPLTFLPPADTTAGENIYRLENSRLVAMDLFLVPLPRFSRPLYLR